MRQGRQGRKESTGAEAREGLPGACPRLAQVRSLTEHAGCPYCFGDRRDIRSSQATTLSRAEWISSS